MRLTFFTSINNAYFSKAKLLSESLKAHHPDSKFVCVLVDEPVPNWQELAANFDEILVPSDDLIPDFRKWVFQHTVVEACTGVKGPALRQLLSDQETDAVIYLDPDIYVYSPLVEVIDALKRSPIVLTPHLTEAALKTETIRANEYSALLHGTFNLGFVAVARNDEGIRFADWWADRLVGHCFDEKNIGLFTDQRWVDLAPSYFPDLHILRQPGTNFATWNCESRQLGRDADGRLTSNSEPLRFVHFSGFDSGAHENAREHFAPNDFVFRELSKQYSASLSSSSVKWVDQLPWTFGTNKMGERISPEWRRRFRDNAESFSLYQDPFEIPSIQFSPLISSDPISRITKLYGLTLGDWVDLLGPEHDSLDESQTAIPQPLSLKITHRHSANRPLICHIAHGLGGGVDMHVRELINQTSGRCDSLLVEPVGHFEDAQQLRITYFGSSNGEIWSDFMKMSPDQFVKFLDQSKVAMVHLHHTLNAHSFLATALPLLPMKVIVTIHDHFFLTKNWSFQLSKSGHIEKEKYREWLLEEFRSDQSRGLETNAIIEACSRVIYPSEFVKSNYEACIDIQHSVVAPHFEFPRPETEPVQKSHRLNQGQPVRKIAVIGDLGDHKGLQEIKSFSQWLRKSNSLMEIHHYGPTNLQLNGMVIPHGVFERKDLGSKLWNDHVDVVWLPNKTPESYSYVLSDVMRSMLPLLAYDVGAISERALGRPLTQIIDIASSNEELFQYFSEFHKMSHSKNQLAEPKNSNYYTNGYMELVISNGT